MEHLKNRSYQKVREVSPVNCIIIIALVIVIRLEFACLVAANLSRCSIVLLAVVLFIVSFTTTHARTTIN